MDEPPRAVTAAAARAARESPPESPEAAGAGRAARDEEERAAHWGERRAARERDRSASPPPPAGHASSYKQFKFRSGAKQYAEASLGANGYPGIVKAADWPGWRLRRQASQIWYGRRRSVLSPTSRANPPASCPFGSPLVGYCCRLRPRGSLRNHVRNRSAAWPLLPSRTCFVHSW